VTEITFNVERCEETGWLSASWDAPGAGGGIVTQGKDLHELQAMIKEAVHCHFGDVMRGEQSTRSPIADT